MHFTALCVQLFLAHADMAVPKKIRGKKRRRRKIVELESSVLAVSNGRWISLKLLEVRGCDLGTALKYISWTHFA